MLLSQRAKHQRTGRNETPLYISRIVRANTNSKRGLVGQPLLAVHFSGDEFMLDSQERPSHWNRRLPTHSKFPPKHDAAPSSNLRETRCPRLNG